MPRPINRASDMNIMKLIEASTRMINAALLLRSSVGRLAFAVSVASLTRYSAPTSADSSSARLVARFSLLLPGQSFTIHTCRSVNGSSRSI